MSQPAVAILSDRLTFSAVSAADFDELVALRIAAMRDSLERIGRFDPERARERLRKSFYPEHSEFILLDGQRIGFSTFRLTGDAFNLDHLYVHPAHQSRGVGSHVLRRLLSQSDARQMAVHLGALPDSPSNRFYRRHGFVQTAEDEWDIYYIRTPQPHETKNAGPRAAAKGDASPVPMNIEIRQAEDRDIEHVSSLLVEAADWLQERGIPMWRADELSPERIAGDVRRGEFFVAEVGGEIAGTVKFQLQDELFWPDVPADEAAFVHRLAVRRSLAGGQISGALLEWAAERARRFQRHFLRLDCEAARPRLRAVYERFGFRHHSDRQVGPYFVARYEREIP